MICPFPKTAADRVTLGQGLDVWRAFFSCIRPGINRVFLNFEPGVGMMRESGNLLAVLKKVAGVQDVAQLDWNDRRMPGDIKIRLKRFLMGLIVTMTIRDPKIKL